MTAHPGLKDEALAAAVFELEQNGPIAIATPRIRGWRILVFRPGRTTPSLDRALTHWKEFRPLSAGPALLDFRWKIHAHAHDVRSRADAWQYHQPGQPHPRAADLPMINTDTEMWTAPVHWKEGR